MEQGSLLGLIPLAVYIVLCFTRFGQIFAVIAGMLVAAVIGHHGIMDIAAAVRGGLGSFLGYIGMIILLGAGLGQVLKRTGVVRHLVFMVTERWNINSQNRAFLVVMSCSVIIVSLLGTMAGGNAILAPILIPIAAAVGVTPNAMAVLLHGGRCVRSLPWAIHSSNGGVDGVYRIVLSSGSAERWAACLDNNVACYLFLGKEGSKDFYR